jgi:hypothetical protein
MTGQGQNSSKKSVMDDEVVMIPLVRMLQTV